MRVELIADPNVAEASRMHVDGNATTMPTAPASYPEGSLPGATAHLPNGKISVDGVGQPAGLAAGIAASDAGMMLQSVRAVVDNQPEEKSTALDRAWLCFTGDERRRILTRSLIPSGWGMCLCAVLCCAVLRISWPSSREY